MDITQGPSLTLYFVPLAPNRSSVEGGSIAKGRGTDVADR